ncbi:MAG TPA: HD domain-containing protein [Candidatus Poseidoniales archaeon]|jgi:HD superfamily phosphohydrolase|nr:MAG: hypothetical protein CXT69_00165 [Euryarchaeota archaeon]HIG03028.1 HD domain-containing protein [Candidatus Poseidoniales archaeon]HIK79252.1 HD domain-containing protein [Candidatus Poseidoniales archaeon]
MRERVIRDEVHKDILITANIGKLIDTREFQRLRWVKQLSTCYYVFPSANHNRFVHSLGAYHLACVLTDQLMANHSNKLNEEDSELVRIAALLHDIGHPPFSHLLETPEVFATYHSHEHWGALLLSSKDTEIGAALHEILGEERLGRLFAIMNGDFEYAGKAIAPFLKEIVSSQLDVDRMDYLMRDEANTGAQIGGFDVERVFRALRLNDEGKFFVMNWGLPAIEAYLVTRFHMYSQVYFHKVNLLTQAYLVRMLNRARILHMDGKLELSRPLKNMLCNDKLTVKDYVELCDSHIIVALPEWAEHEDVILSSNANRLISRRDFHKSLRISNLTLEMVDVFREQIEKVVAENGFDPKVDVIVARIAKTGYMPYEEGIYLQEGKDVSEVSDLIRSLTIPTELVMVFVPESVRDECDVLARSIIKPKQASLGEF